MKKITTKLSNLFKLYDIQDYETEFDTQDQQIYIKDPDNNYVLINYLIKKKSNMISMNIEGFDDNFVCSDRHYILTIDGFKLAKDVNEIVTSEGNVHKVLQILEIGEGDAFDVALDYPHVYQTPNKLVHHNTFISIYKALEEVMDKGNPFSTLVIVRSAVQTRDVGFTPGSLEDKMSLYEEPYVQICSTLFGRKDAYQRLKEQGYIEFVSTTALRGCSFDNSVVLFDEVQNGNFHELDTVLTRVGHNSKIIFCGDYSQTDLIKKTNDQSGLPDFLRVASTMAEFTKIIFTPDDICRSSLVKNWIIAKEKLGL